MQPEFSAVAAEAGVADAAEGEGEIGRLLGDVVAAGAAGGDQAGALFEEVVGLGKDIQGEGGAVDGDVVEKFVFRVIGDDRKERAKNFILHAVGIPCGIG